MARRKTLLPVSPAASVPMSAMIDVVFLLLVYFIVSQKPVTEDVHLNIDLPGPSIKATKNEPLQILTIDVVKLREDNYEETQELLKKEKDPALRRAILAKRKIYYHVNNEVRYESAQLKDYLRKVADADSDTNIIIKCGPNPRHAKLINLLDMCDDLGLTKLSIVPDKSIRFVPDPVEKR